MVLISTLSISIIGYINDIDAIYENNSYNQAADLYYSADTSLQRGIHYIYALLDLPLTYDLKIVYHQNPDIMMDEFLSFEKVNYELGVWESTANALYWSVVLDKKTSSEVYRNPYLNEWYNNYVSMQCNSFVTYQHPEINFIGDSIISTLVIPFTTNLLITMENNVMTEGTTNPLFICMNMLLYTYVISILLMFLFSFYTNFNKDENTVDQDYLIAAMTVEAEEEIASIDDIAMSLFILIFVFSWFFFTNSLFILNNVPEIGFLFYNLPFIYYMIILIPTSLLFDFGINFAAYLRGASSTASFVMELLYDYIAVGAFYIRLLVQNVRLILMTLVFFALYECIMVFVSFTSWVGNNEMLWDSNNINYNNYTSYYYLIRIPSQLLYWMYELLHTFFVVTAQFTAFFAMIFWLFLFLFTMFVHEQQEKYLAEKRESRKQNKKI